MAIHMMQEQRRANNRARLAAAAARIRVPKDWACPVCRDRRVAAISPIGFVTCVNGHESW